MNWKVISIISVVLFCVVAVIYDKGQDVYPQVEQSEQQLTWRELALRAFELKVKQRYVLYPPAKEYGWHYLVDTETGDVWREVLNVSDAGHAWVYMPKEPPMPFDEWLKVYKK